MYSTNEEDLEKETGWIAWDCCADKLNMYGVPHCLTPSDMVQVRYRDGVTDRKPRYAGGFGWKEYGEYTVVAYRVAAPARKPAPESKPTNPKDAVGTKKPQMSCVPATVMAETGLAMLEGARKYGRHNYRETGVRSSVYYDAAIGHLMQFWEGEDIDKDSGLSHITKAIASLVVLRDAQITGIYVDDRPPPSPEGWWSHMKKVAEDIINKYPDAKPAIINKKKEQGELDV